VRRSTLIISVDDAGGHDEEERVRVAADGVAADDYLLADLQRDIGIDNGIVECVTTMSGADVFSGSLLETLFAI
jgi:hypothetical protein